MPSSHAVKVGVCIALCRSRALQWGKGDSMVMAPSDLYSKLSRSEVSGPNSEAAACPFPML